MYNSQTNILCYFIFFKYISLIMLLQLSHSPLYYPLPCTPPHTHIPPHSSCPWVVHISSLASTFPILYLTSPCLFSTYQLVALIPCTFSPILPLPLPADNPPCDLYFWDFILVLVVCLVCFRSYFFLGSVVYSCEFIVILLFMVLIFFFLGKSL